MSEKTASVHVTHLLRKLAKIESKPPQRVSTEEDRGLWSKIREAFTGT